MSDTSLSIDWISTNKEDKKVVAPSKREQELIDAKIEFIDKKLIDIKVAQIINENIMPTVTEMIDHLSHHYGFDRHEIRQILKQELMGVAA